MGSSSVLDWNWFCLLYCRQDHDNMQKHDPSIHLCVISPLWLVTWWPTFIAAVVSLDVAHFGTNRFYRLSWIGPPLIPKQPMHMHFPTMHHFTAWIWCPLPPSSTYARTPPCLVHLMPFVRFRLQAWRTSAKLPLFGR